MGFDVIVFFDMDVLDVEINMLLVIKDIGIIWDLNCIGDVYYIFVYEYIELEKIYFWLCEFLKYYCCFVIVVFLFRGLLLYNIDMFFIFSYEVMLLRI